MPSELWNTLLSAAIGVVILLIGWLARTVIGNRRDIDTIMAAVDSNRIQADIGVLHKRMTDCSNHLAKLQGQLGPLEKQLSLINQYLMERGK